MEKIQKKAVFMIVGFGVGVASVALHEDNQATFTHEDTFEKHSAKIVCIQTPVTASSVSAISVSAGSSYQLLPRSYTETPSIKV